MKEQGFITTSELCEWLRITRTTVLNWRNAGMPYHGKGKSLRYLKSEVERWLKEQTKK